MSFCDEWLVHCHDLVSFVRHKEREKKKTVPCRLATRKFFARLGVDLSGLLSKLLLPFPPFFRVIAAAPQPIVSDVRR